MTTFKNFLLEKSYSLKMPYIIAEAGVNHEGSIDIAKRLIHEAKAGGADAIKFQSYKAETLASKNSPSYWDLTKEPTTSQYELFKKHDSFWKNEFEILKKECEKIDIEFLSTPFDNESAIFLNDLMDVYKISSSDITNFNFIEKICSFNKPIILSTGASYLHEIQEAVSLIEEFNNCPLTLLHCVLNYPTPNEFANLGMISGLKQHFPDLIIGYSDHTLPGEMNNLIYAYSLGALVIEKHFTHDKSLQGNDHYHAMDMNDLKLFLNKLNQFKTLYGTSKITALKSEETARNNARRSLVAARKIKRGSIIDAKDLTWKRPAHGISAKFFNDLLGKNSNLDIEEDTVLTWSMFN